MRCPDCQKFVSLEFQDPEVESIEIEGLTVTAMVRIVRVCAECSQEMKEATLEMSAELDASEFADHWDEEKGEPREGCELTVEECGADQIEEGGGRYKKSYFGAEVSYEVYCECSKSGEKSKLVHEGTLSDKVPASAMDELV